MIGILDRYVGKNVLMTVLLVTLLLTLLTTLITFVDRIRYIGRGDVDFIFLVKYIAWQIPSIAVTFFPVSVLLSGVVALGNLARTSELIILQSIGISRAGIVMSSFKLLFPLILVMLVIGETVAPKLDQYAETRLNQIVSRGQISVTYNGLWMRDGDSFIAVQHTLSDNSLQRVVRYDFDGLDLIRISRADTGVYQPDKEDWLMLNITHTSFLDDRVEITNTDREEWNMLLTPERLEVLNVSVYQLSITGLIDYIGYLEENNVDASNYRLQLYNKFVMPFAIVVMLLLAASTVFGSLRSISMGARILAGIGLGFSFYVANQIGAPFALVFGIAPIVGAVFPTLLFALLAIFLLSRKA